MGTLGEVFQKTEILCYKSRGTGTSLSLAHTFSPYNEIQKGSKVKRKPIFTENSKVGFIITDVAFFWISDQILGVKNTYNYTTMIFKFYPKSLF